MVKVSSWGRLSRSQHKVVALSDRQEASESAGDSKPGITYGMGRSYGDVCLNPGGTLWATRRLDRFVSFDEAKGRITCESGVLLRDIQRTAIPRGWMLPVSPGTQLVTVGGAIANDVHGKNHHRFGTFADHVSRISMIRTSGEHIECGPRQKEDWFRATAGGLGLTGVILLAEIQLRRIPGPWLESETIPFFSLDEFFSLAGQSESRWEYTVAWIDCLARDNRGLFMRANHIEATQAPPKRSSLRMPVTPPISMVNRLTLRPFNYLYFKMRRRRQGRQIVHYESFFYPLDNIHEWNRLYGPAGFYQYQCVVPGTAGPRAMKQILATIRASGSGSFLSVLKTFGAREPAGLLSFPQAGVTLALDFPNRGLATEDLFARLDAILVDAGGRIYPAKDARMPKFLFQQSYPALAEFLSYRDPGISSAMSRRLMGY